MTTNSLCWSLLCFCLILSQIPSSSSQEEVGTWVTPIQNNRPTPRYYAKMVEFQGYAYMFGGSGSSVPGKQVRRYHFENSTWESLPDLPSAIYAYAAVKTEDDLVVLHGGIEDNTRNSAVHTYNLRTNEYKSPVVVNGASPPARSLHSSVMYQNKMIIYGGGTGIGSAYFTDIWSFDVATSTWAQLSQFGTAPLGRIGHTAVVSSDGIMVIYGGFNARYNAPAIFYNDIAYYDIKNNTWLNVQVTGTQPLATYDMGSAITSNNIMIIFGGTCDGTGCYPENNLARFDINTSTWLPSNALNTGPLGRSAMACVLLSDTYFLIFGGLRESGTGTLASRDDMGYFVVNPIPGTDSETIVSEEGSSSADVTTDDAIQTPSNPSSKSSDTPVIAAVAGTVGGIVFIIMAAVIFLLFRKKREQKKQDKENRKNEEHGADLQVIVPESATNYARIPITAPSTAKAKEISSWQINWSEVEIEKELGRGAFGVVYKGKWRMQEVAVKRIIGEFSASLVDEFIEEAKLMSKLRPHENVVQFLGISRDPLAILTSFYEGGSLSSFLQSHKALTEYEMVVILQGVAAGMQHLHLERIIHRDLAARNVLIGNEANSWKAVVSDFGFARAVLKTEGQTQSDIGPVRWMSPESILQRQYSTKSDVWSFGVFNMGSCNERSSSLG